MCMILSSVSVRAHGREIRFAVCEGVLGGSGLPSVTLEQLIIAYFVLLCWFSCHL